MDLQKTKKLLQKFHGFTLVELIVVITILAILGTIAFVSFGSYSSSARDSKRISNISILDKGFGLAIAAGKTINTSESLSGTDLYNIYINGSGLTLSGVFDTPIKPKLLMSLGVSSEELKVNDGIYQYKYTYVPSSKYYQVMVELENKPNSAYIMGGLDRLSGIINNIFADEDTITKYAFIKGNYVETGSIVGIIPSNITPEISQTYTVSGTIDNIITPDSIIENNTNSTPVENTYSIIECPPSKSIKNNTTPTKTTIINNIGEYTGCKIDNYSGGTGKPYIAGTTNSGNDVLISSELNDGEGIPWKNDNGITLNSLNYSNGWDNTSAIITAGTSLHPAAKKCIDKLPSGIRYLPAQEELSIIYNNLKVINVGSFNNTFYWSSTDFDAFNTRTINFSDGGQSLMGKMSWRYVRCSSKF